MKKFENLGRSLSKNEQKIILGGNAPGDESGTCTCANGTTETCKNCSIAENKIYCDGTFKKNC